MSLTDAQIRSFKPNGQKQEHATGTKGLYLVVGTTGTKSFVLRYKRGGKSARYTLGTYPDLKLGDASNEAGAIKKNIKGGIYPEPKRGKVPLAQPAPTNAMTVKRAFARYMERHWGSDDPETAGKRNRGRWSMFENNFEEPLGDKMLASLTKAEIKKVLRDKHEAMLEEGYSGRGIGNIHGMFSAFLSWCAKHDDLTGLDSNPMANMPKIDNGGERDRWFDRDECRWFLKALAAVANGFGKPLELLLRSGTRKSDIFDLTRSMVVLDNDDLGPHLLIPRTKNEEPHVVPLVPSMLKLLPDLKGMAPDQTIWLCSGESTSNVKERIEKEMERLAKRALKDWRFHDLRTTVGTHLDSFGVDDRVIEKILCHKEPNRAKRTYRRYAFYNEKKAALQQWNDLLDTLAKAA